MTVCQDARESSGKLNEFFLYFINTFDHPSRHNVCVWSILDLPTILQSGKIIINKVMTKHDPVIGECLRDSVKKREISEQNH